MSLLLLAALAVVASGCVHTCPVSLASVDGRAEVNGRARRGYAIVAIDGQRGRGARALRVDADTTRWTDFQTGEPRSAPTDRVTSVTFRRDGVGALKGAAVGAGVGAAVLLLTTPDSEYFPPPLMAGLGAVPGALLGSAVGATRSERHVYRVASPAGGASRQPVESCGGLPLACAASPPHRP